MPHRRGHPRADRERELETREWQTSEWPPGYPPSVLELSFKKKEDGTKLIMVHSKVPASQAESYRQGWVDAYWEPLKAYFEKRHA